MKKVYALNGFLGLPSDWELSGCLFESVDSLEFFLPTLEQSAHALNTWVANQGHDKPILLGYSQGGRLAMHALIDEPDLWGGAILISTHTGLKTAEERKQRLQSDAAWSRRFLEEPWHDLMNAWEGQEVFKGGCSFQRKECDYKRKLLAEVLVSWSLGRQRDLEEELCQLKCPLLWMAGEQDEKYAQIAQHMAAQHVASSCCIVSGARHRVPWECSDMFKQCVKQFDQSISVPNP